MTMAAERVALCGHCSLPAGLRPVMRRVAGNACAFCCYGCAIAFQVRNGSLEEAEAVEGLVRLGVAAFFAMNIMVLSLLIYSGGLDAAGEGLRWAINGVLWLLATPAVAILAWPFACDTWRDLRAGRFGSSSLVVIGVAAAYGYSAFAVLAGRPDVYFDTAIMVLVLFTLGRYVEATARARAARDLAPMLEAETQWVTRVEAVGEVRRAIADIVPGDRIRVAAGERVGVDGRVLSGCAHVDEAVATGESRPAAKGPGDRVAAGSIALDGTLLVRCEAAGAATQWGRICRGVRRALASRSPLVGATDRAAAVFVPLVLAVAGATVVVTAQELSLDAALLRGLAVLVVACPCAIGLAAPLAMAFGVSRLAQQGCVVRDGRAIELLARVRTAIFDKTGTLTSGTPRLVELSTSTSPSADVLRRAAGLEQHSGHVLAPAVLSAAAERALEPDSLTDIRVVPGGGVFGVAACDTSAIGSAEWLVEFGFVADAELVAKVHAFAELGYAVACVGWGGRMQGVLAFEDTLRPRTQGVTAALRDLGVRTLVLSGDQLEATRRVAETVAADGWHAKVLPESKAALVARWRYDSGPIALVGDGLNDGLALVEADVGIAVSTATGLAREAADLVLPPAGVALLPGIIALARTVRRMLVVILLRAFGYNFIAIALAAAGWLPPVIAAALMAGSSLVVVASFLRLQRTVDVSYVRSAE